MVSVVVKINNVEVSSHIESLEVEESLSVAIPECRFTGVRRFFPLYPPLPGDRVEVWLNGVQVFKGQVDECTPTRTKGQGTKLLVRARGAVAALDRIYINRTFTNQTAYTIVNELVNEYNAKKLAQDPAIITDALSNQAPNTSPLYSFEWRRKPIKQCLEDLAMALLAPSPLGHGKLFDFYVGFDGKLYFFEQGSRPQNPVTIPNNVITSYQYPENADDVKTEAFVIGDSISGTLPTSARARRPFIDLPEADPWTEGNASDYEPDPGMTLSNDTTVKLVGNSSIKAETLTVMKGGWALNFPNSGWPTRLDCYNESEVSENMGEIKGLAFFIRTSTPIDLTVEAWQYVPSGDPPIVKRDLVVDTVNQWLQIVLSFGPSATDWQLRQGTTFNWGDVYKIKWIAFKRTGNVPGMTIWLDGLRLVKPLVVRYTAPGTGTRRQTILTKESITDYKVAELVAQSVVETLRWSKQSVVITLPGSASQASSINLGDKFIVDTQDLRSGLLTYACRKKVHRVSKSQGYTVTIHGDKSIASFLPTEPQTLGKILRDIHTLIDELGFRRPRPIGSPSAPPSPTVPQVQGGQVTTGADGKATIVFNPAFTIPPALALTVINSGLDQLVPAVESLTNTQAVISVGKIAQTGVDNPMTLAGEPHAHAPGTLQVPSHYHDISTGAVTSHPGYTSTVGPVYVTGTTATESIHRHPYSDIPRHGHVRELLSGVTVLWMAVEKTQ